MEKIKLLCKLEKSAAGRGGVRKNSRPVRQLTDEAAPAGNTIL